MPCLITQLDRLESRLHGERRPPSIRRQSIANPPFLELFFLNPEQGDDNSAWDAAIADGVTAHLDPAAAQGAERALPAGFGAGES